MADQEIPKLRVPQARVLRALMPVDSKDLPDEWPLLRRDIMAIRAGYTPISGSITRALMGIKEGSSSGDAHPGILTMGLIETVELDICGLMETNYRITRLGVLAFQRFLEEGGKLPTVRDPSIHTNQRYADTHSVAKFKRIAKQYGAG